MPRCSYPDDRRETGECGRDAITVYESSIDDQPRCRRHDSGEVARFAAEAGYVRHPLLGGAVDRVGAQQLDAAKVAILQAITSAPSIDGWAEA